MPRVSPQHALARRRQILDAALRRFADQGFHRTSMQDVFEESGLSPGAVYRYFAGKEELVGAIVRETLAGLGEAAGRAIDGADAPDPAALVGALLAALVRRPDRERRMRLAVQVWAEAARNPDVRACLRDAADELRGRVRDALVAAQRAGRMDPALDASATAAAVLALLQGYILHRALFAGPRPAAFRRSAEALAGGLAGPPA